MFLKTTVNRKTGKNDRVSNVSHVLATSKADMLIYADKSKQKQNLLLSVLGTKLLAEWRPGSAS